MHHESLIKLDRIQRQLIRGIKNHLAIKLLMT
jgi:hypothetical protein